ncbi:MAG: hypothetical protein HKN82_02425 [Akkermansiaceae bacterium]|nr:hypothetical protein [Akkermansiaceae bacterium]
MKDYLKMGASCAVRSIRRAAGLEKHSESVRSDASELWNYLVRFTPAQRRLRRGQLKDYSGLHVSPEAEAETLALREMARAIYGQRYEYMSFATNREVVHVFETVLDSLAGRFERINYLEIGSAQGLSMSLMGLLLRQKRRLGRLVSVDPYFDDGYVEGQRSPWGKSGVSQATDGMREGALRLYESAGLDVEQRRTTSLNGLRELIAEEARFELIYVDGYHEGLTPAVDIGLSLALLADNGVIMLDDHQWPDVSPLENLLRQHSKSIVRNWKIAAFSANLHGEVNDARVEAPPAREAEKVAT